MSSLSEPRIFSLGDNAITIDFGNRISAKTNDRVLSLAGYFDENPFYGFIETVPAYGSLTVFYDVYKIRKYYTGFEIAFDFVRAEIEKALLETNEKPRVESRLVEIPVCFDGEFAPDLELIAAEKNLSPEKTIEIFLARTYRVFLLGFLPGFAYMGEVDERIAMPRKQNPRLKVPAGSVGIAGKQTGIYSLESPGGWQIVGQTPIKIFNPQNEPPTFLQAGDEVRFYRIERDLFPSLAEKR